LAGITPPLPCRVPKAWKQFPHFMQAKKAAEVIDGVRQEAARERDRLHGEVEREGREAGRDKERLRAEAEAVRKELEERKRALDHEKVGWASFGHGTTAGLPRRLP